MKELLEALRAVMKEAVYVQKNGRNAFHGYKYATEADLVAVVRPAMINHGLLLIGPSVEGDERTDEHGNTFVTLTYTLAHVSGAVWPEKLRVIGCGNDRAKNGTIGDKGAYKAYTGAVKYLLFKLLLIETGDDPEVVSDHDQTSSLEPPPNNGEPKSTDDQHLKILVQWERLGFQGDSKRIIAHIKEHTGKASRKELSRAEAAKYLVYLESLKPGEDPERIVDQAIRDNDVDPFDASDAKKDLGIDPGATLTVDQAVAVAGKIREKRKAMEAK